MATYTLLSFTRTYDDPPVRQDAVSKEFKYEYNEVVGWVIIKNKSTGVTYARRVYLHDDTTHWCFATNGSYFSNINHWVDEDEQ